MDPRGPPAAADSRRSWLPYNYPCDVPALLLALLANGVPPPLLGVPGPERGAGEGGLDPLRNAANGLKENPDPDGAGAACYCRIS